jgi:cytochrome c peroxidase
VVAFYNEGGDASGFAGTKDRRMRPLDLTPGEIDDLVAFLETLTGDPIPAALLEDTSFTGGGKP